MRKNHTIGPPKFQKTINSYIIHNYHRTSPRPISTTQLNMLPCVHLWPINLVVYKGSYCLRHGKSNLGAGFTLRCFQRLSYPNLATLLCRWHDNRYTSGLSIPVLSY